MSFEGGDQFTAKTMAFLCLKDVYSWFHTAVKQVNLFLLQNVQLQQENTELRQELQSAQEQAAVAQQAIRDRDEAIAKWEAILLFNIFNVNNKDIQCIQINLHVCCITAAIIDFYMRQFCMFGQMSNNYCHF